MKTFVAVLAAAWLSTAPVLALERCTRSLIGSGPELGPVVCQEVTSDRGTTVAIREAHEIRHPGPHDTTSTDDADIPAPVGSMTSIDKTGFSRRGAEAGDPRHYCGQDQSCQQWYVDNAYVAQNGEVRMKQPWRHHHGWRHGISPSAPNIVLHPAR